MPVDVKENTIRIRVQDPKKYIRFITKEIGKGIKAVIGFKKEGGSEAQSYIFDKSIWDVDRAKAWVERHKLYDDVNFPVPTLSQIYDLRKEMALLLSRTRKFSLGEIANWTSLSKSCILILQKQHNLK